MIYKFNMGGDKISTALRDSTLGFYGFANLIATLGFGLQNRNNPSVELRDVVLQWCTNIIFITIRLTKQHKAALTVTSCVYR